MLPLALIVRILFAKIIIDISCAVWLVLSLCFLQMIPVKINSDMLKHFKKDSVVIEVWTKIPSPSKANDRLLGLVKIPLHNFYLALDTSKQARCFINFLV